MFKWEMPSWWLNKNATYNWNKKQKEAAKTGTRYYGDGGTIHHSNQLDVETYQGRVVAVWFRCQPLPFKESIVDLARSASMDNLYDGNSYLLTGVEIKCEDKNG